MRSRRVIWWAVVALGAAIALPATAGAARTKVAGAGGATQLAGDRVIWADATDAAYVVRAARPGEEPRTLRTFPRPAVDEAEAFSRGVTFAFAASETRLAMSAVPFVVQGQQTSATGQGTFDVGPIDGPYAQPAEYCGTTGDADLGFDVDGDRVAFEECSPTYGDHRIIVRHLGSGELVGAVPVTGLVRGVRLAGNYLAYRYQPRGGDTRIAVYDLGARGVAYEVPSAYHDFPGLAGQDFDVQADGKLARLNRVPDSGGHDGFRACPVLEWFSRAEPVAHGLSGCPSGQVEIAGDRILYSTIVGAGRGLALVDLRDGSLRRVVTGEGMTVPSSGFDFDGSRASYPLLGCSQSSGEIWLNDLSGPEQVEDSRCPVRIGSGPLTVRRNGTAVVTLACARGCTGTVEIVRVSRTEPVVGRARTVTLDPGESRRVAIRIDSGTRKVLRRRNVAAMVRVLSRTRAQQLEQTSRRVTLRR